MAKGSVEEHDEIERKYDVAPDAGDVPDLSDLPGVASVTPAEEYDQVATYFDTEDFVLLRSRVTLRRRTGGADDGWHLKLPARVGRTEVHAPIADPDDADEAVPDALQDRVRALVRDRRLMPSAVLRTRRRVHRLLDADGRVLAELCDDRVEARVSSADSDQRWREWELELVDGSTEFLDVAEPELLAAGASPSTSASKLARALGGAFTAGSLAPPATGLSRDASTLQALTAYLAVHLRNLHDEDGRIRTGEQESIHQMRIAARRIRSALASYGPVLDAEASRSLRAELRWLGELLASARDAQVIRERLLAQLADQPADFVRGPVGERIDHDLRMMFRAASASAVAELDGERYFRLLDRMQAFVERPPVTPRGHRPAIEVLPQLLRRDLRRVRRRHRVLLAAGSADERDRALHDVRKAAKRLRYSAESAVPVLGRRAEGLSVRAKALQQVLGEHQDTVVARRTLLELAERAALAAEDAFPYGRLHALEESRATELAAAYLALYDALPSPRKVRSWARR